MSTVSESVEIMAPVHDVYNEWTDFTQLPQILSFVTRVDVLDEKRSHWVINIAGKEYEYDAEVTNHVPDSLISWRSVVGDEMDGAVTFESLEGNATKLTVQLRWEPEGMMESAGAMMNIDSMAVASDLKQFRDRAEERHQRNFPVA